MWTDRSGQPFRAMCVVLAVSLATLPAASTAAAAGPLQSERREDKPPQVRPNRTVPKSGPASPVVTIPDSPSDADLFRARVFSEPLVPVGPPTSAAENQALGRALTAYLVAPGERSVGEIDRFLQAHPRSAWRASLLGNLGILYRWTGYFTKALAAWEEAWTLARHATEGNARAVGDLILGDLADLNARLGRFERLEALFAEAGGRDVRGSASEKVSGARQGLWRMRNRPGEAFLCGPMALDRILMATRAGYRGDARIAAVQSTQRGTSLLQMHALANEVGLKLQMARRSAGADFLLPALVHWRAGHFAALVAEQGGRYRVQDPTFGDEMWVSREALEDETSGYFLVPIGSLPDGWRSVAGEEGAKVWGKGAAGGFEPGNNGEDDEKECPCESGRCGPGMAFHSFHVLIVNLNIVDTPVGYTPPRGPAVRFRATYNQREAFQPQVFFFSNLGPKWTFDWMSYVEDDPSNPAANVTVFLRGGSHDVYSGYDPPTSSYQPALKSRAIVVRTGTSPIRYERRLPDGSVEVFAQSDGAGAAPRRVFMTQVIDPQGNALTLTYDASLRLVGVTDAIGQVTTLSYEDPANPLRITKVTDPFSRYATFTYNTSGRLMRITDVIGITSEFTYGSADLITSLTTPYGTTTFEMGESDGGLNRWIEAVDPLGGRERLEYINATNEMLGSDPASTVPTGFAVRNERLNQSVTLYWDKRGMAYYPDRSKAKQTVWLRKWLPGEVLLAAPPKHSQKLPLENRVWFSYPGQTHWLYTLGMYSTSPEKVARVLDGGQFGPSQIYSYEYNLKGKVTRATDPVGRETVYEYDTNGIDLLRVKQKNGGSYDLLQSYTYNAQHLPLTATDAAGQTTTYTYKPDGRLETVVTPPRGGLTLAQRTTTYSYFPDTAPLGPGRLQTVTGPDPGDVTSFTYDVYGRVRTVTDSDSYTLTHDYDALDRQSKLTYPDGTYEETVYNRLDPEKRRDRLGRWSHTFHDALRRVAATRDPAGRTTTQQWCTCGSLDKLIDGNGNATTWEWDEQGRLRREVRADGSATELTYEQTTSRLNMVKDAKNQQIWYTYTLDDQLQSVSYVNAQQATPTLTLGYDPVYRRLASMQHGSDTTTYGYHPVTVPPALGATQLATEDGPLPNDTIAYAYDELGRVQTRTINGVGVTRSFDALGRLTTQTTPLGTFGFTYEGATTRLATITYPSGQTANYAYLGNGGDHRLLDLHNKRAGGATISRFQYSYDAVGNILSWSQQAETSPARVYSLGYDAADQLTSATVTAPVPPPVPSRFRYAYDGTGNRTAEQLDDAVTGGTYNNRNQLTSRQPGGMLLFRGTLSEGAAVTIQGKPVDVAADNTFTVVGQAQVPAGTSNVVIEATDPSSNRRTNTYQINQTGSTNTFTYDANGNLTADGTKTFEWDAANRLTRVCTGTCGTGTDPANMLARFVYDGQGRRYQKITGGVTRTYIYEGDHVAEERLSSGGLIRYFHGPGIDDWLGRQEADGSATYFAADHLGSVTQHTNSTGQVTLTRSYDPWGKLDTTSAGVSGLAYTGREWDAETGLYYYRARFYDPKLGRFLSEDPIGLAEGPNLHAYVFNRPVNLVDPYGELPNFTGFLQKALLVLQLIFTQENRADTTMQEATQQQQTQQQAGQAGSRAGSAGPGGGKGPGGGDKGGPGGGKGGGGKGGGSGGRGGGARGAGGGPSVCIIVMVINGIIYAIEVEECKKDPCGCGLPECIT